VDLIRKLLADKHFSSFYLVGGTALALRIGHRRSVDIDLFTASDFNSNNISKYLISDYRAQRVQTINNGVFSFIEGVKVDILAHKYPLVDKAQEFEGIRMLSLKDIGAMKLNAIYGNGSRLKDFIDMYALLEIYPLRELLAASEKKYPENNIAIVKQALVHHQDIDFSVRIDYINREVKWKAIEDRLKKAFHNPQMTFGLAEKARRQEETRGRRKRPGL